ncbi:hypothetical protein ACSQ67_000461 [Phaseolus vulgaris]
MEQERVVAERSTNSGGEWSYAAVAIEVWFDFHLKEMVKGLNQKKERRKRFKYPVEVNGSLLDGEGGTCKYNHCGKSRSMLGEVERHASGVGTESAVAAAATCVVAEELASVEAMRSAVVGGKEASRPIVVGGEEVSRPHCGWLRFGGWSACLNGRLSPSDRGIRGAAPSNGGVLYVDLSAAAGGDLVSTPSSAIGANSIDGVEDRGGAET